MRSFHPIARLAFPLCILPAFVPAPSAGQVEVTIGEAQAGPGYHQRAAELMNYANDARKSSEAASLLLKCAELQSSGSAHAVQDRLTAGRLYFYSQMYWRAQAQFTRAADEALALGDLETAAHAYIDGAVSALNRERKQEALELGQKALKIARSPLLTEEQRKDITDRIANPKGSDPR